MSSKSKEGGGSGKFASTHLLLSQNITSAIWGIFVIVLFMIEVADWYTNDSVAALFFLGLPILFIAVRSLFFGIEHAVQKEYKSAALKILIAFMLTCSFALPSAILSIDGNHFDYARDVAYFMKLTLNEERYLQEIELTHPDDRGYRFKKFSWGINSADAGDSTDLIYDESDEMALLDGQRSQKWWKNAGENSRDFFGGCNYEVRKIKSHFYVVRFICG
ncbi:hypothetical protein GALL_04290 [mine drainage metagenome]|uniref:Uncharacterized protein n=1 Tax=mine drainage metagenome TaxID=410659 RepID=A0A1J5U0J8_9ZZZZ